MTANTKHKILNSALELFNRDGIVNVRLQHIADIAIISVGNLAYHYTNKEGIVMAIYDELTKKQNNLLAEFRIVPLFDSFDRLLTATFALQSDYIFFYLDTLEIIRAYPSIGAKHQQHIANHISQLRTIIDFNVARGALVKEPMEGVYYALAQQIWMTIDLRMTQQLIMEDRSVIEENYKNSIWNLLIPSFTEMGKQEYLQMLQHPYDFYF